MASAEDLLEELLQKQLELVRAKKGSEREAELEARIAALEAKLEEKPGVEVEEAYEQLTDEEEAIVAKALADHRAGRQAASEEPAGASEEEKAKRVPTRVGRKRGNAYSFDPDTGEPLDHAYVYSGDDEPDRVPLKVIEPPEEQVA